MKKIDLDRIDKKLPFSVEDDYFDKLEIRIQNRVRPAKTQIQILPVLRWAIIPALGLLLSFYFFNQNQATEQSSNQLIAQLSNEEILVYLENSDLTEYEITSLSGDLDLNLDELNFMDQLDIEDNELDNLLQHYDLKDFDFDEI